jgi:hypothetical protein
MQLAQKKSAVAALQPQLVIVDNNDGIAHENFTRRSSIPRFQKV